MSGEWNRYGPTVARGRGTGHRFKTRAAIDMHGHVYVPEADALLGGLPRGDGGGSIAAGTLVLNRRQNEERRANMVDMDLRLRDLDAMGLARQAILPAPGQCFYAAEPESAARATRVLNDGIAELSAKGEGRFLPFGSVPMQQADLAVAELERCMGELGAAPFDARHAPPGARVRILQRHGPRSPHRVAKLRHQPLRRVRRGHQENFLLMRPGQKI